jgi:hypothetical protein
MRDIDIINDIKTRESQITQIQEEITALKRVAEIYGLNSNSVVQSDIKNQNSEDTSILSKPKETNNQVKRGFGASKWSRSIADAVEDILRNEENGLHLDEISKRLANEGMTPTMGSLDSALRQDGKKHRFKLVSPRTYGLVKRS